MNHVAQEHPKCESSSAGIVSAWVFWNALFLGGLVFGLEASGYSVLGALTSVL